MYELMRGTPSTAGRHQQLDFISVMWTYYETCLQCIVADIIYTRIFIAFYFILAVTPKRRGRIGSIVLGACHCLPVRQFGETSTR